MARIDPKITAAIHAAIDEINRQQAKKLKKAKDTVLYD